MTWQQGSHKDEDRAGARHCRGSAGKRAAAADYECRLSVTHLVGNGRNRATAVVIEGTHTCTKKRAAYWGHAPRKCASSLRSKMISGGVRYAIRELFATADRYVYLEQKKSFGIIPHSPKSRTRTRDFAHQIGPFEKPSRADMLLVAATLRIILFRGP